MNYLIFTSYEVGGLPFKMAEILNRHGLKTFYVSIEKNAHPAQHDSTSFHYGTARPDWDLSHLIQKMDFPVGITSVVRDIKIRYGIGACFATGWKVYILKDADLPYNYWSFGSDLDQLCFFSHWKTEYRRRHYLLNLLMSGKPKPIRIAARLSIRRANNLMISPYQWESYRKLGSEIPLFFLPHYFNQDNYETTLARKKDSTMRMRQALGCSRYFLSTVRHFWAGDHSRYSDNKGNDVAIKSYALYVNLSGDKSSRLVLIRKGPDVEASAGLARGLGIERNIVWLDEIPRERLAELYEGADFCLGQFGTPCLSFASLEPLVVGTPCVSAFDWKLLAANPVPYYATPPPMYDSRDPGMIAEFIAKSIGSPPLGESLCRDSWRWIAENCTETEFVKAFEASFRKNSS